jgi:hypothetical protein
LNTIFNQRGGAGGAPPANFIRIMKTYVLILSKKFPVTHSLAGCPTHFADLVRGFSKLHTIRLNYELWKKRFLEIDAGRALLSVREWTGLPYRSKQKELFKLDHTLGIGLQKLHIFKEGYFVDDTIKVPIAEISKNDGFCHPLDFQEWFKKVNGEPLAIIQFSNFRYLKPKK